MELRNQGQMSLYTIKPVPMAILLWWTQLKTFCCVIVGSWDDGGFSGQRMKFRALFGSMSLNCSRIGNLRRAME